MPRNNNNTATAPATVTRKRNRPDDAPAVATAAPVAVVDDAPAADAPAVDAPAPAPVVVVAPTAAPERTAATTGDAFAVCRAVAVATATGADPVASVVATLATMPAGVRRAALARAAKIDTSASVVAACDGARATLPADVGGGPRQRGGGMSTTTKRSALAGRIALRFAIPDAIAAALSSTGGPVVVRERWTIAAHRDDAGDVVGVTLTRGPVDAAGGDDTDG